MHQDDGVIIKVQCSSRSIGIRFRLTISPDLVHVIGNVATGSTEFGVALNRAVRIVPYNEK
jgi:hypothetical protein